ncbi:MAG: YkgJ family cysteine cluster protein [Desulfobacterales bacterium]|nr:YkgJ family cysteine cluster protein [Desulfobacterales bacterium]MBF0397185.1 YkgJ family cysteine cluster protein [Desulfobacterales bacterium]
MTCNKCGKCCIKGGPTLHLVDKDLIIKGLIPISFLYTIRKSELVYENVKNKLVSLDIEIIKIKGKKDSWECIFFNSDTNNCGIYENRPIECKVLYCFDTREIEKVYAKERITRNDLIPNKNTFWNLINIHEQTCSYDKIKNLLTHHESIIKLVKYDMNLRGLVLEKSGIDVDSLDFYFGRPLFQTIKSFGFNLQSF